MPQNRNSPIAVIGLQCRFPGGAISPEKLWEALVSGTNTWSRVPSDRFNEEAFFHPNPDDTNGTNNHRGGHFLKEDIREFDNEFFNSKSHSQDQVTSCCGCWSFSTKLNCAIASDGYVRRSQNYD